MFSSYYISLYILVSTLVPLTFGDGIEVQFGHDPDLDVAPGSDSPKLRSRDFEPLFADDPGAGGKPSSGDTKLAHRAIEVQFAYDPELDKSSTDPKISSRDFEPLFADDPGVGGKSSSGDPKLIHRAIEVQFAYDPELDKPSSSDPKISSRDFKPLFADDPGLGDAHTPDTSKILRRDTTFPPDVKLKMDDQLHDNERCAAQVQKNKKWQRSSEIDKRVDTSPKRKQPANIMFGADANMCRIVDQGRAQFLQWGATNMIGTVGLCGCTAVAIVSQAGGAIVAHWSPNANNYQQQWDNLWQLFDTNLRGQPAYAYIFGPEHNGVPRVPQLPDNIRTDIMNNMGISIVRGTYEQGDPNDPAQGTDGTLLIQLAQGALYVWLNNRRVH
jgi:hypothetical protein